MPNPSDSPADHTLDAPNESEVVDRVALATTTEKLQSQLLDIMRLSKGDRADLAYVLYAILRDSPTEIRVSLLRFVAENYDEAVANRSEQVALDAIISSAQQAELQRKYQRVIWGMLEALVGQNFEEDHFYESLWGIIDNPFFTDEISRAYTLHKILINNRIPYFKVENGLRMADSDYDAKIRQLRTETAKIRSILNRQFEQRPERADLLLRTIMDQPDEIDRVILMDNLIFQLEVEKLSYISSDAMRWSLSIRSCISTNTCESTSNCG